MSDHKEEAERIIDAAHRESNALNIAEIHAAEAAAHVHATLYVGEQTARLAEQQRIANLISFLGAEGGPYKAINDVAGGWSSAIEQVVEGLGLS